MAYHHHVVLTDHPNTIGVIIPISTPSVLNDPVKSSFVPPSILLANLPPQPNEAGAHLEKQDSNTPNPSHPASLVVHSFLLDLSILFYTMPV